MTDQLDGLPKSLRIGPYTITIGTLPPDHEDCGNFEFGKGLLCVQGGFYTPVMAVDTFIHELIHAAFRIYAITDDEALEERVCATVAPTLTQIFLDHPEVLRWMQKQLKK